MKILSVAEDNLYNLWQLELQIYHFKKLGLEHNFVPIVVGREDKPSDYAEKLSNQKQRIYYYKMGVVDFFSKPDYYPPAIQPFGIYEYLKEIKSDERIFIIDVDVIFRDRKTFEDLEFLDVNTIYTSPSSYSRIDYYTARGGTFATAYDKMFEYLNLDRSKVESLEERYNINRDDNPSGHTIVLGDPDPLFFKKVTKDSLVLHELLKLHSKEVKEHMSWMGMLWAYYYNCIITNKPVESTYKLDFCWAVSPADCDKPILHMAGAMKNNPEKIFSKLDFMGLSPFNPDNKKKLDEYVLDNGSKQYVETVKEYLEHNPVCI